MISKSIFLFLSHFLKEDEEIVMRIDYFSIGVSDCGIRKIRVTINREKII